MKILALVGSLRDGSTNRLLAQAALAHLPAGTEGRVWEGLADLPHYSEELDTESVDPAVAALRAAVAEADALLVVTPEYNGAMSGVLKNAIDWASRPRGAASLAGKPAAVLAASAAPRNAIWARENAVRVLQVAGASVLPTTFGIASSFQAFDGEGRLVDTGADGELGALVHELVREQVAAA